MLASALCVNGMPSTLDIIYPQQQQVTFTDSDDAKYVVTFIDPNTGMVETSKFPTKAGADQQLAFYGVPIDSAASDDEIVGTNPTQYQNDDSPFTGSSGNAIEDLTRTLLSHLAHLSDNESDFHRNFYEFINRLTDKSVN